MEQVADEFNTHCTLFKYFNNLRQMREALRKAKTPSKAMNKQLSFSGEKGLWGEYSSNGLTFSRQADSVQTEQSPTFGKTPKKPEVKLFQIQERQKEKSVENKQKMNENAKKMKAIREQKAQEKLMRERQQEEMELEKIRLHKQRKQKEAGRQKEQKESLQVWQQKTELAESHFRQNVYVQVMNHLISLANRGRVAREQENKQTLQAQDNLYNHLIPKYFHHLWKNVQEKKRKMRRFDSFRRQTELRKCWIALQNTKK